MGKSKKDTKSVKHDVDYGAAHGPSPGAAHGNEFNHEETHSHQGRGMFTIAGSNFEVPIPGGENEMDAAIKKEVGAHGGHPKGGR